MQAPVVRGRRGPQGGSVPPPRPLPPPLAPETARGTISICMYVFYIDTVPRASYNFRHVAPEDRRPNAGPLLLSLYAGSRWQGSSCCRRGVTVPPPNAEPDPA